MKFTESTYNNLMNLCNKSEAFYYKDFPLDDKVYRIMNYRLASWTLFQEPSALNCRGIMYDVTDESNPVLVSLPPEKFFNYEEGGVDHTKGKLGDKMVKMDGSLISTYIHNNDVYFKSKGSLFSSQAFDAMKLLNKDEYNCFKVDILKLINMGFTVNLEYTSPENRIVIPYQKEELTLLSVRSHEDGKSYFATSLTKLLDELNLNFLKEKLVAFESMGGHDVEQLKFVDDVRQETDGEGYVVEIVLDSGESYLTKIKNIKYLTLHQTKDSVNSARRLFDAVIEEASDDLRSMFADDEYVLNKVAEMENKVQPIFNHMVRTVEGFHSENKALDRKDYAIKAQKEQPELMGLIMNAYLNKPIDYKEFAKKHRKDYFKIDDTPDVDLEEMPLQKSVRS